MTLDTLREHWDLIVIGGGITGAGILLEAARAGLSVLLLEKNDFAAGTSSRSSKLVHGGLRYLRQGRFFLTRAAVVERERLLTEAPGLVDPSHFLVPLYAGRPPGRSSLRIGLTIYDRIAGRRTHQYHTAAALREWMPALRPTGLRGGFGFEDAQTDDARLVLRLIQEAEAHGATACNYTAVHSIHRSRAGQVAAVTAVDGRTGLHRRLNSRAVINATGVWAQGLHRPPTARRHLRPLRGSHLVLPARRLPLPTAVSFSHPADGRAVFVLPWEGAALVGTTDLDHRPPLDEEPRPSIAEIDYLLAAANHICPDARLGLDDAVCAFAGVRPVVGRGDRAPSQESRDHVVWARDGLVTVTGGKLTTFRRLAGDALKAVTPWLPRKPDPVGRKPVFSFRPDPSIPVPGIPPQVARRLIGRYGPAAAALCHAAAAGEREPIPDTPVLWAELPYVAGERVHHLTDLLMRRVRLGILLPDGGRRHLPRIRRLCQPVLGWDDRRWQAEEDAYVAYWQRYCRVPAQ